LTESERLEEAARLLGHVFARPELLREALTHRSAALGRQHGRGRKTPKSTGGGSNERLEFIGDRVLGLVMAEWVAERFPSEQEGALGPRHAHLVSREAVAEVAERIGLAALLSLGANEALAGVGRLTTVLADALEAGLGALYLDGGLPAAQRFIRSAWAPMMEAQTKPPKDPKTALQEVVLAREDKLPAYRVVSRHGPPHAPHFVIEVSARGKTGSGEGGTKRMAEREAAADLLAKLS
jgi:ribonuclease-3